MTGVETVGESGVGFQAQVDPERAAARQHLEDRWNFSAHLVSFIVVNTFLIGIWAFTGAGYFWPAWVIGGWGIGLVLHAWTVFVRKPVTEADVDAELRRCQHR